MNELKPQQSIAFDREWNAGDLGCGDLVLELRIKLRESPGSLLKVVALDPGAPADIPAWCRMTGNELVSQDPAAQAYFIRAKL
jgi:tRNA 2-thiouridine synthesizing protein A